MRNDIKNFSKLNLNCPDAGDGEIIFLYEITLQNLRKIFLTSGSDTYNIHNIKYNACSKIRIESFELGDNAEDNAQLSGNYEDEGITKSDDLSNAQIAVYVLTSTHKEKIFDFYCTKIESNEYGFNLRLSANSNKFNQDCLLTFSKTCRARLGDKKCGINLAKYTKKINILEIQNFYIITDMQEKDPSYYEFGYLNIIQKNGNANKFVIVSHAENKIRLIQACKIEISDIESVYISAGCNKQFITCCKKFNNELNFRGEPFIPDFKILEN